jgi:formate/nitrite transporter FocA (FNT family)
LRRSDKRVNDPIVADSREDPAQKPPPHLEESPGKTVQLSSNEEQEVQHRVALRAAVVFETVRREGETEINRPIAALAFSALAAGLSMGFSLIGTGLLRAYLPEASWKPLVENLGYTLGFLVVIMGRQQLFTENTVTAIIPVLDNWDRGRTALKTLRLWAIVIAGNVAGAALFAYAVAHSGVFEAPIRAAFLQIGLQTLSPGSPEIFLRGIFSGWMIALMVWLLPASENQRVSVITIITYVVGVGGLSHVVAGSVEALYAVAADAATWPQFFTHFFVPVFLGNSLGGVALVSLLNYGQVAPESTEGDE